MCLLPQSLITYQLMCIFLPPSLSPSLPPSLSPPLSLSQAYMHVHHNLKCILSIITSNSKTCTFCATVSVTCCLSQYLPRPLWHSHLTYFAHKWCANSMIRETLYVCIYTRMALPCIYIYSTLSRQALCHIITAITLPVCVSQVVLVQSTHTHTHTT